MRNTRKQQDLRLAQTALGCLVATNSRAMELRGKDPSNRRPSPDRIASLKASLSKLSREDLSTLWDVLDTAETLYLANTHRAHNIK